jgi:hypothetical protein
LNSESKYALTELLAIFQYNHHALVDDGIAPYYCFDGFHHPMKKVAWEEQENKYNVTKQWLHCFYIFMTMPIMTTRLMMRDVSLQ